VAKGWKRWTVGAAFVAVLAVCAVAVLHLEIDVGRNKGPAPVRVRNFGEGLTLSQHGLYGVDLIRVGKAQMRKMRKGPFTLGGLNELVLDDLSVVLPDDGEAAASASPETAVTNGVDAVREKGPKELLDRMGLDVRHLKLGGSIPRFSGLEICRLSVSRLVDGTNVVPWFAAQRAEARRDGLLLTNCSSFQPDGATNVSERALFVLSPKPALHLFR